MERGLGTIDYNDNQSNLRVSWQQVHQNYHSIMSHQADGDRAFITSFTPQTHHNKPEEHPDTLPSDYQPPGVDEKEPQSLEEALTG